MQVAEGLEWLKIYWYSGTTPKGARFSNSVKDPPCNGWQRAFLLRGEKRSTIFCPFSFQTYDVPNGCSEIERADEPDAFRPIFMRKLLEGNWKQMQSFGWQRSYDICARVMRLLDWPVPEQIMAGGGADDRRKGGKETADRLLKPVKADGKRGLFLKWFLDGGGSRSVREAMLEFDMTRSNALSYLFILQKTHGIGYTLVGDTATVILPEGCTNPFKEAEDDSWLD